jgi:hypothetical protein
MQGLPCMAHAPHTHCQEYFDTERKRLFKWVSNALCIVVVDGWKVWKNHRAARPAGKSGPQWAQTTCLARSLILSTDHLTPPFSTSPVSVGQGCRAGPSQTSGSELLTVGFPPLQETNSINNIRPSRCSILKSHHRQQQRRPNTNVSSCSHVIHGNKSFVLRTSIDDMRVGFTAVPVPWKAGQATVIFCLCLACMLFNRRGLPLQCAGPSGEKGETRLGGVSQVPSKAQHKPRLGDAAPSSGRRYQFMKNLSAGNFL